MHRFVLVALTLLLSATSLPLFVSTPVVVAAPASDEMCFRETGHCLSGRFLDYWRTNGGLPVFGFPITPARWEPNRDAATARTQPVLWTQWFERARLEHHPKNPAPFDVLLGRLGSDRLAQQGRDWSMAFTPGRPQPDCHWFDTQHTLCDRLADGQAPGFRSYYARHGLRLPGLSAFDNSVALFGLPLSEPQVERNASGQTVLTQWFERGRFEWHPDEPEPYRVLLGLLGKEVYADQPAPAPGVVGAAASDDSTDVTTVTATIWSGQPADLIRQADAPIYVTAAALQRNGKPVPGTVAEVVPVPAGQDTVTIPIHLIEGPGEHESTTIRVCQVPPEAAPQPSRPGGAGDCLEFPYPKLWTTEDASRPGAITAASPFRNVCRISREGFRRLITSRAAPEVLAERDPGEYWDAIRDQKVDPLLIAAIFQHESQMGAKGVARTTRSWGNTRAPSFGATPVGTAPGRTGTFPIFASWRDGAISTAARLSAPDWVYANRHTIGAIFIHSSGKVWAPSGDRNNPTAYLKAVLTFMRRYADQPASPC